MEIMLFYSAECFSTLPSKLASDYKATLLTLWRYSGEICYWEIQSRKTLRTWSTLHCCNLKERSMISFSEASWQRLLLKAKSIYNAGQKKRNSELRIFRAPPEGGGSTFNMVQHTQGNFKTVQHNYSTPSSIVNHHQSRSTSSRELTKNSWIRVAFLLTSIVLGVSCPEFKGTTRAFFWDTVVLA